MRARARGHGAVLTAAACLAVAELVFPMIFEVYFAVWLHQLPVAIFSMEMPGEQLALRMLSSLGHIDQHKIRTGKLDDDDWP